MRRGGSGYSGGGKKSSRSTSQYDHLQGSPINPVDHGAYNIPQPAGGLYNGVDLTGSPPENSIEYDNQGY